MSRLDSFIRRMEAQRDCLNAAAEAVADIEGPVFELGLGNGRTYTHLLEIAPGRDVYVFERKVAAHPASIPDEDHLILGDILETLPSAADRFEGQVALAHTDLGTGVKADNMALAAKISPLLYRAMAVGGVVVSGDALDDGVGATANGAPSVSWVRVPLPPSVAEGRYFVYKKN